MYIYIYIYITCISSIPTVARLSGYRRDSSLAIECSGLPAPAVPGVGHCGARKRVCV